MTIDTSKMKFSTKSLLSLVVTAGSLWNIQAVRDFAIAMIHAHPRYAGVFATISSLWAILHDPDVEKVLGIDSKNEGQQ